MLGMKDRKLETEVMSNEVMSVDNSVSGSGHVRRRRNKSMSMVAHRPRTRSQTRNE